MNRSYRFIVLASIVILAVSKGKARKAGDEHLIFEDGSQLQPGASSPALQLIQQVRDEAHRFAITGHRGRRQKKQHSSQLAQIDGVGAKRRMALLKHFGGLVGLKAASTEEISRVAGIHKELAKRIYTALHELDY